MITIEETSELARKSLIEQGKHMPQFNLVHLDGKISLILAPFKDSKEKEIMRDMISKFVEKEKIIKYFFITEAWLSKVGLGDYPVRPTYDRNRISSLIICEFNKDMTKNMLSIPFHKENGKIIFQEEEKFNNVIGEFDSFFNVYLEKEGYNERQDKRIEELKNEFFKLASKEISDKFKERFINAKSNEEHNLIFKEMLNDMLQRKHKFKKSILTKEEAERD